MAKTATLTARIDPELKKEAEEILSALGIPSSGAITMFYTQIVQHRGIPFEVKLARTVPQDFAELSDKERHELLSAGWKDMQAGHSRPAPDVFDELRSIMVGDDDELAD